MARQDATVTVKLLVGDARDRIREIPDGSVDLLCCSPPFLALRKYGDNAAEMGSELTPADFLDALLELTTEFRRVLTPHGSIAIELGDTYSGSGGAGGDYNPGGLRNGQEKFDGSAARHKWDRSSGRTAPGGQPYADTFKGGGPGGVGWPLPKSLTLIPTLYPASLAYGWNMLNPAHTFDRWRVRNVVVWARPNPPVGALGDKVRPATSYITVACTSAKRWFDLDAVRTEFRGVNAEKQANGWKVTDSAKGVETGRNARERTSYGDPAGAPPLDWWEDDDPTGHATLVLPTQPYPGAHYATWPEALASRLIKMLCPLRVCTTCGEPSRRIVGDATYARTDTDRVPARLAMREGGRVADGANQWKLASGDRGNTSVTRNAPTLGWSSCGHNTWRPGHTLDPFAGSGTTLAVAQGLARDATGIELYSENAHLCRQRIGMYLDIDGAVA